MSYTQTASSFFDGDCNGSQKFFKVVPGFSKSCEYIYLRMASSASAGPLPSLLGHKEKPPRETGMTLREMAVYQKILSDVRRQLSNLLCVVIGPADDQLEEMIRDADDLKQDVTKFEERFKCL